MSVQNKEPAVSECIHYKMLKEIGFERPCETHCLMGCRYIRDPHSFSDARICCVVDEHGNMTRHFEIVPSSESLDKAVWQDFRLWQIREKIVERNFPDEGIRDISFKRFDEELKRKVEIASRPRLDIGITPYVSVEKIRTLWQSAFDNGFLPVLTTM